MRRRACLLAALPGLAGAEAPPLRVCIDEAPHTPWRVADEDGRLRGQGLEFEFLLLLQRHSGWRLQTLVAPWRRCLSDARSGAVDLVMGISHTPERAEFLDYPMRDGAPDLDYALRVDHYAWVAQAGLALQWDGQRLQLPAGRGRIGVQAGYSAARLVRAQGLEPQESARTVAGMLEHLQRGALDLVLVPLLEARRELQRAGAFPGLRLLEPPLPPRPYFLMATRAFAAREPQRAQALAGWVRALRASEAFRAAEADAAAR